MARRTLIIAAFALVIGLTLLNHDHSRRASAQTSADTPTVCTPVPPPPCKDGASPGVIQIVPDGSADSKVKLARKRFYLSSCPFNLEASANLKDAPTLREFYSSIGAKPQLIAWLEENHCQAIYCRLLTKNEVTCESEDQKKCVPEFVAAYRNALSDLRGDADLALQMITNYPPLSNPKLRTGFYEARAEWLKNAVSNIERAVATNYRLRTMITDKDGVGFFYDLCPGSYYVSSVAPIDIEGKAFFWESAKPIVVDGPPNKNDATKVTLAFAASNKKNTIVGKPISDLTNSKPAGQ